MQKIKKICVFSPGYPTENYPMFPFVDQLLCAFARCGVECTVIAPQSIVKNLLDKQYRRPQYWERKIGNNTIKVYQPYMFSASNLTINGQPISDLFFEKAAEGIFRKIIANESFDVLYGHFWRCGLLAAKMGKKYEIPAFVACGESVIPVNELKRNWNYKNYMSGVVCVSSKSLRESVEKGLSKEENCIVCPNAIDESLFLVRNKNLLREKLGISKDIFIVAFVGSFIERKGTKRLSDALEGIKDAFSIFIGSGPQEPTCKNQLFVGKLAHEEIPNYLNVADVFVLPTLNEGCCNAIVEAMACGLPVISSDMEFNKDILDNTNSILIDPVNIDEIRDSIILLKENKEYRSVLSDGARIKASKLTIMQRANTILNFMENRI